MKLVPFLFVLAFASPRASFASEDFYKLYDIAPGSITESARLAAEKMAQTCGRHTLSRVGPTLAQQKQCESLEAAVVAQGPAGVRAALALLDRVDMQLARHYLYDVVVRSGDLQVVGTLVHALEVEEQAGMANSRHYEREFITRTLTALTYAEPLGTPALAWHAWADAHRDLTREQLYVEHGADCENLLVHGTIEQQAAAAAFLARRPETRARAKAALDTLAARTDLSIAERNAVRRALGEIPTEAVPVEHRKGGGQAVVRGPVG